MGEEENDEELYACPLLHKQIDQGACYDINAVTEKWVIKEVLTIIEKQYETNIDVFKAERVCPKCKHYPFKHISKFKSIL
jgi:hypothetical protein